MNRVSNRICSGTEMVPSHLQPIRKAPFSLCPGYVLPTLGSNSQLNPTCHVSTSVSVRWLLGPLLFQVLLDEGESVVEALWIRTCLLGPGHLITQGALRTELDSVPVP